jgi:hypothetical protein
VDRKGTDPSAYPTSYSCLGHSPNRSLRDHKNLWSTADRVRANLDAAVYNHAVLGLFFLKSVSDAFETRR